MGANAFPNGMDDTYDRNNDDGNSIDVCHIGGVAGNNVCGKAVP